MWFITEPSTTTEPSPRTSSSMTWGCDTWQPGHCCMMWFMRTPPHGNGGATRTLTSQWTRVACGSSTLQWTTITTNKRWSSSVNWILETCHWKRKQPGGQGSSETPMVTASSSVVSCMLSMCTTKRKEKWTMLMTPTPTLRPSHACPSPMNTPSPPRLTTTPKRRFCMPGTTAISSHIRLTLSTSDTVHSGCQYGT